ncbi:MULTISPECIES: hypothetical protein [Streptomycetaceae]|uniref:hypothetical protein n=1 Tax=Streptomycetaceae TaxID=2062 RepID=UPI001E3DFE5E|nr:hypothetical protein [Streptantibioticus cattleyicolor]
MAHALPAAVVPSRTTVAVRRALRVTMLLGGFLAVAFLFAGRAHADTPRVPGVPGAHTAARSTTPHRAATGKALAAAASSAADRGEIPGVARGAVDGGSGLDATGVPGDVARMAVVRPVGTLDDALEPGRVIGAVRQVAGRLVPVAAGPSAGAPGGGHHVVAGSRAGHGGATATRRTASPAADVAPTTTGGGHAAYAVSGAHTGVQVAHRRPAHAPAAPAGHQEHPGESDGVHHDGGAHATLPASGARLPLNAVAIRAAHGSSPLQRPANVSVQPD